MKKSAKKKSAKKKSSAKKSTRKNPAWKSRIVGHDRTDPNALLQNPFNHRLHPEKQRKALAAAIREVGFIRSVTVNKTTGHIIDGHERVYQAIEDKQELIDVEYVDLSEAEERKALASMDAIGEMAEVDPDSLARLLDEIGPCETELDDLFASMTDSADLERTAEDERPQSQSKPKRKKATISDDRQDDLTDHRIVIAECKDESEQKSLYEELTGRGLTCRMSNA